MDKADVQQNLEKTLNLMESIKNNSEIKEFYSGVNSLIEQTGYKKVELKKPWNEYFAKQNEDGENLVFIEFARRIEEKINQYGFAKVKPGKLEEFCERLNQDYMSNQGMCNLAVNILAGAGTGTGIALWGKQIYHFIEGTQATTAATAIIGVLGFTGGICILSPIFGLIRKRRNYRKLRRCYSLFRFDEEALKLAFSQKN